MQASRIPSKFPIPWGNNAGAGYIRNVPTASQINSTPGAASLTDGFPPVCALPVSAGGTPPFMQDFNGILNVLTAWMQWYQAGGPIGYDGGFQANIGGYPGGAQVFSQTVPGRIWLSTVDNNLTNPDAGGAGWSILNNGRLINYRSFMNAGTYTYAPAAGATFIVVTVVGAGGAGGGSFRGAAGYYVVGSGGAAGSAGMSILRSGFSGATIIVGAGGTPTAATGNPGGTSSFGSLLSAPGGGGGLSFALPANQIGSAGQGVSGGPSVGGNIYNSAGNPGACGLLQGITPVSGQGGASIFGGAGMNTSSGNGNAAAGPGAGGGGAGATDTLPGPFNGGPGADGAVIIQEFS